MANPECDDLSVRVLDEKNNRSVLGWVKIILSDLVQKPESRMRRQPVKLLGSNHTSYIIMGMKLMFPRIDATVVGPEEERESVNV